MWYFCVLHWLVNLVLEDAEREVRDHLLSDPLAGVDRVFGPNGWAGRENFDEGEALVVPLNFERATNSLAGLHNILVIRECDAFDIDGRFELGDEFGPMEREALVDRASPPGTGR